MTGISAASALSNVDACRFYYQEAGFSNPGACKSSLYTAGRLRQSLYISDLDFDDEATVQVVLWSSLPGGC